MSKDKRVFTIIFLSVALVAMMLYLSGCSSIRKLKTNVKTTEQLKTTEQTTKAKDSTVTTVTKKIDSAGTTVTVVFDNDGKDTATNVEITTYPPSKEEYNSNRKIGVKTNRTPKSITVNQAEKKADEKAVTANVKTNETKASTTDKVTTTVVKNKQVAKTRFQWWIVAVPFVVILLIVLAAWLVFDLTPIALLKRIKSLFTKNNNMKNLILVVTIATLFSSCWKWDKPTPPRELPAGVYQEERVPVYDSVYVLDVTAKQYVKQWGIARYKVVPIKEMEVVPTGKQVMKFSYFAGYGWLQLIGLILIAGMLYVLFALHIANDEKLLRKAQLRLGKLATGISISTRGQAVTIIRGVAVGLIFALAFLTLHPGAIAQNNAKTITEKQLKHYQAIDPELNYFWDSVYKAGGITTIKQPK
jgi:uncharacterized protein YceK